MFHQVIPKAGVKLLRTIIGYMYTGVGFKRVCSIFYFYSYVCVLGTVSKDLVPLASCPPMRVNPIPTHPFVVTVLEEDI